MEKIYNYVRNGKGIGLLFLLALAVLVSIFVMLNFKNFYNSVEPQVQLVAKDFLPLTVENGKIIAPNSAYKRVEINLGDSRDVNSLFPIVLDTREDVSAMPKEKSGLFVMKDMVYLMMPDQIRKFNIPDGVLDEAKFNETLDSTVGTVSFFMSLIVVAVMFVTVLIKALFALVFGILLCKLLKKSEEWNANALMRLCCVLVAAVELISWVLGLVGVPITGIMVFVMVILAEMFVLYQSKTE